MGWWLATDFAEDLTDGLVVSNGFCSGFNGWVGAGGATDFAEDLTDGVLVGQLTINN